MIMRETFSCSCGPIISSIRPFDTRLRSKFYDQYSVDDILSQEYLMVMGVPCDMRKNPFKDTFFEMNTFPKKKSISFYKFYDNEGATTQLLLRSNHFINMTV